MHWLASGNPWVDRLDPAYWVMRVRSSDCFLFKNQIWACPDCRLDATPTCWQVLFHFRLLSHIRFFIMTLKKCSVLRVQGTHTGSLHDRYKMDYSLVENRSYFLVDSAFICWNFAAYKYICKDQCLDLSQLYCFIHWLAGKSTHFVFIYSQGWVMVWCGAAADSEQPDVRF